MTDRDALLRSILEHPQEDLPRLVYADWLEDAGEVDRAEFVRVQVELARSARPCPQGIANAEVGYRQNPHRCFMCSDTGGVIYDCDDPAELRRRERDLLEANFCNWVPLSWHQGSGVGIRLRIDNPIVVEFTGSFLHAAIFHRGFINWMSCSWSNWLRHHAGLFWSPRQTVEVPSGICHCGEECESHYSGSGHSPVDMPDCIPRPFVPTAQPLELCTLTDTPYDDGHPAHLSDDGNTLSTGRREFHRVKCCRCGNRRDWHDAITGNGSCLDCHGTPLNRWTCPEWPGLEFVMPTT